MEENLYQRMAPHASEAERAIIGAMLVNKEAIEVAAESLIEEDFYDRQLGTYFATILDLYKAGSDVDPIVVKKRLESKNLPPECVTDAFIGDLVSGRFNSSHTSTYVQEVKDNAIRRKLIQVAETITSDCYLGEKDIDLLLDTAEKNIFDITRNLNRGDFEPIGKIVIDSLQHIAEVSKNKSRVTGIPTYFPDLDEATAGFQPSDFILIAARPSMGKSAFALSLINNMSIKNNYHAALFSLEMSKEQLANRLFSMGSKVPLKQIRLGDLLDSDWDRLVQSADRLAESNLIIDETSGISVAELRSKCRKYKAEQGLDIIFIDYLQLMSPGRSRSSDSRQQEISDISRSLKSLARELNVPVVALSQLSRAVESRTDHRPMLSDLRESGAIEQDADVVMFLYRDEYYNKGTEHPEETELIIAKQRNGPTGTKYLRFMKESTSFVSLEYDRGFNEQ